MRVFRGRTANAAWLSALEGFREDEGVGKHSGRGGSTSEILHASFVVDQPRERFVVSREPAMNPAFALAEVIWIVNGRQDAEFVNFWNPKLPRFAGEGPTYHGAYGFRLRSGYEVDQIKRAFQALKSNEGTRQVVLQIWDPRLDLPTIAGEPRARDIPCNVCSLLKVRDGRLDWTQIMRSNDLILGFPHNVVQFTYLQEFMAGWLGCEVGVYTHLSDSLHVYDRNLGSVEDADSVAPEENTDEWKFSYAEGTAILGEVSARMELLKEADAPGAVADAVESSSVPEAAKNMLRITGADAARRHGWREEADELAEACSNPALVQPWRRWRSRQQNEEMSRDRT